MDTKCHHNADGIIGSWHCNLLFNPTSTVLLLYAPGPCTERQPAALGDAVGLVLELFRPELRHTTAPHMQDFGIMHTRGHMSAGKKRA
eukprot:1008301-Pelagomonas_calceolata.AAC.5